jgi:hypothetical protein
MAYYIPFINSEDDWSVARQVYPDSVVYRVTMRSQEEVGWDALPHGKLWVDAEIDALHNWPNSGNRDYTSYFGNFVGAEKIADATFWTKPDKSTIANFVNAILGNVLDKVPGVDWLSVPQLPHLNGTDRNKVNRALAEATHYWKSKRGFKGKLIPPGHIHSSEPTEQQDGTKQQGLSGDFVL